MVNVSLLQTPGGPKFINFMQEFSLFVLKTQILRLKAKFGDHSPILKCSSTSQNLIQLKIAYNVRTISTINDDLQNYEATLQKDVNQCVEEYRALRSEIQELESKIAEFDDPELEQKCQTFLEKSNELTTQTDSYMNQIKSDLKVVQDIIDEGDDGALKLDLTQIAREGDDLPDVFDKIWALAEDQKRRIQPIKFDLEPVQSQNERFYQEGQMLQGRKNQLENELLPKVKDQIRALEARLDPLKHPITLAQMPKIHLNFSSPSQKPLNGCLDLRPVKNEDIKPVISQTPKLSSGPKRIPNFYQPSMISEASFQEDEEPESMTNQRFQPTRSQISSTSSNNHNYTRGDTSQTRVCSIEESKMSVFSPILSSSRMEPNSPRFSSNVISPQRPGLTLEQSKIAHYRSILNATKASNSRKVQESPQVLIEKQDPVIMPTAFEPVRLSSTLWEESPIKDDGSELQRKPQTMESEDQNIATRLDDLMNTLALDSSNLLDEDWVDEMPSMHLNL